MAVFQQELFDQLLGELEGLRRMVDETPSQLQDSYAEKAVMEWLRVAEGLAPVQLRLNEDGLMEGAFHQAMESDPALQIDRSGQEAAYAGFGPLWQARQQALKEELELFFRPMGYRTSGDVCDRMMLSVSRLSRFLSMWLAKAEAEAEAPVAGLEPHPPKLHPRALPATQAARMVPYLRHLHLLWEPYLNNAVVAWEENSLEPFVKTLEALYALFELPPEGLEPFFPQTGTPLRMAGRPRAKVLDTSPPFKAPTGKPVFAIRYNGLMKRLNEMRGGVVQLQGLLSDVRHFSAMFKANRFLLSSEAGFTRPGGGNHLVRANSANHPLLMDPMNFFKKSRLFQNNTYSVDGGGVGDIYLLLRQLERHYKFQTSNSSRLTQAIITECVLAWEANRGEQFTHHLVRLANHVLAQKGMSVPAWAG